MLLKLLLSGGCFDSLSLTRAFTTDLTCAKLNTFIPHLLVFVLYSPLKVCFNKSQLDQRLGGEICIDLWLLWKCVLFFLLLFSQAGQIRGRLKSVCTIQSLICIQLYLKYIVCDWSSELSISSVENTELQHYTGNCSVYFLAFEMPLNFSRSVCLFGHRNVQTITRICLKCIFFSSFRVGFPPAVIDAGKGMSAESRRAWIEEKSLILKQTYW